MKKISGFLFGLIGILIVIFIIVMFGADSDVMIWRAFSIIMPIIGVSFGVAVILLIIDFIQSKKK